MWFSNQAVRWLGGHEQIQTKRYDSSVQTWHRSSLTENLVMLVYTHLIVFIILWTLSTWTFALDSALLVPETGPLLLVSSTSNKTKCFMKSSINLWGEFVDFNILFNHSLFVILRYVPLLFDSSIFELLLYIYTKWISLLQISGDSGTTTLQSSFQSL